MSIQTMQKVTISLPQELLVFADMKANERGVSRSKVIADLLAKYKLIEQDALSAEGYQFYAEESTNFALMSQPASQEGWDHAS